VDVAHSLLAVGASAIVLIYPAPASARGAPPCNRTWTDARREADECGPLVEVLSFVDVVHRPPHTPTLSPPPATGAVDAGQTTFLGFGWTASYMFPGALGVRVFGVRIGSATRATYLGDPGGPQIAAFTALDFAGVFVHGRDRARSWSIGLTPALSEVLAGGLGAYTYGTASEFLVRGDVRGCLGRAARLCAALAPNVWAYGRFANGGALGVSFEWVFLE
jgi:hypothetical protein